MTNDLYDPQTNPTYCGYCKCDPCQCDGHGNYPDDEQESIVADEMEDEEEEWEDEEEEGELTYEDGTPYDPDAHKHEPRARRSMPERTPRPQRAR